MHSQRNFGLVAILTIALSSFGCSDDASDSDGGGGAGGQAAQGNTTTSGTGGRDGAGGDGGSDSGGGDSVLGACPPEFEAQQALGLDALQGNCSACHATDKEGLDRGGAPPNINVDDPASVSEHAEAIFKAVDSGIMPPGGRPLSDATVENIRVYLACTP